MPSFSYLARHSSVVMSWMEALVLASFVALVAGLSSSDWARLDVNGRQTKSFGSFAHACASDAEADGAERAS